MKKVFTILLLGVVSSVNLSASEKVATQDIDDKSNATKQVAQDKPRFSAKNHNRTVLKGKSIELLNVVLTEMPMSTIRMFKAAVSAKKVLSKIEEVKSSGLTLQKEKELEFIKNCLGTVLDPVRDFFVELKAYKSVIGAVFKQSLGENAEQGLLVKSLNQKEDLDIMKFLLIEIISMGDLESAVSEFLIFFSDVEASLTDNARKAYASTLERLKASQKK